MPKGVYAYPAIKTEQVGVPIADVYKPVNASIQADYKQALGLDPTNPVLFITGGGLGALRLNEAVVRVSKTLLARHPQLHILHIAGPGKATSLMAQYKKALGTKAVQVFVEEFVNNMYQYSGAADVIVARAGANTLAEFAAQAKACIVVPNQHLTGGHQLKNAEVLEKHEAIKVVPDEAVQKNAELLLRAIEELLSDTALRRKLGSQLHKTARFDAAEALAKLVIQTAKAGERA
jgi:UDP-N-acetylglucosamine--N-acetylmuramyl-(pentapeptide) pyrophosphoryl-undecaprenol N-acetylglucosamine transferase